MATWRIRAEMAEIDVARRYAGHPTIFSIRLHHGGEFTQYPGRKYVKGKENYVDLLDIETFSTDDLDEMMAYYRHVKEGILLYYHFQKPLSDLDSGLFALASNEDVRHLAKYIRNHKIIDVYIEHGKAVLHTCSMSPNPSTLLPPKHHVQVGRPKKKRTKSAMELEEMVKGVKVSRAQKSVTCSKCSKYGHNARNCKGQTAGTTQSQTSVGGSNNTTRGRGARGKGVRGRGAGTRGAGMMNAGGMNSCSNNATRGRGAGGRGAGRTNAGGMNTGGMNAGSNNPTRGRGAGGRGTGRNTATRGRGAGTKGATGRNAGAGMSS